MNWSPFKTETHPLDSGSSSDPLWKKKSPDYSQWGGYLKKIHIPKQTILIYIKQGNPLDYVSFTVVYRNVPEKFKKMGNV